MLRIKLENDTWPLPFLLTKQRTKTAIILDPFSRRVSRAHMATLAHTYILTRAPHTCTRTDYHSMYTHPCKLLVHIRKYTENVQLCVPIHTYKHKHIQSLCVRTWPTKILIVLVSIILLGLRQLSWSSGRECSSGVQVPQIELMWNLYIIVGFFDEIFAQR